MSTAIRSIATVYRGVRFVSTLEADWAKNLDVGLHIAWSYEPAGLKLPDGQNYRCDFYLPQISTWLEVKGPHNERIDKPAILQEALIHAPGCGRGNPATTLTRPGATCACGYGPGMPYQQVLVGRPGVAGKLTWETAGHDGSRLVLVACRTCQQRSWLDPAGPLICRRCLQPAAGSQAWKSSTLPFLRVEPPRGGRRRPRT